MSLLLLPQVKPSDVSQITLIAGLAVCLAVRQYSGLPALIKWPNDVLIHGKKICGILTEMTAEIDRVSSLVVGIGINVNIDQFPATLKDTATSLSMEAGKQFARAPLVASVLNAFERHYPRAEKIIAEALNTTPETIWPERYAGRSVKNES